MNENEPRAGGLRLIRMLIVGLCVGVIALSFATVLLWQSNGARVEQINNERQRNTAASCVKESARNQANLDFLVSIGAHGELMAKARKAYPVLTDKQCQAQARRQVDTN